MLRNSDRFVSLAQLRPYLGLHRRIGSINYERRATIHERQATAFTNPFDGLFASTNNEPSKNCLNSNSNLAQICNFTSISANSKTIEFDKGNLTVETREELPPDILKKFQELRKFLSQEIEKFRKLKDIDGYVQLEISYIRVDSLTLSMARVSGELILKKTIL